MIGIVVFVAFGRRNDGESIFAGVGCILAGIAVTLFIGTGFGWLLTQGMLTSFDPVLGVTDAVKFFICLAIFVLTGIS